MLRRLIRLVVAVVLACALLPLVGASAAPADLFFSEYVEGSGYNKALELYNATGSAVDLAAGGYAVDFYYNGNPVSTKTVNLVGTVASGDVFVLAEQWGTQDPALLAAADQFDISESWYNGDDALVLRKGGTVVDVIGQVGFDPGTEWGTGLTSTQDNTIRRLPGVCSGDTNPSDSFNPALEWTGYAQNTFDGLGTHTSDCLTPPEPADPIINEFSADTVGDDVEYVEILGDPNTDYAGYTLLEIEGDDTRGLIDEVVGLGTTNAQGYLLMALTTNSLENGTLTLLVVKGFTGVLGDDLDTNDDGTLDAVPWVELVDSVAVNDGGIGDLTYYGPTLGPNFDGLDPSEPGGASRIPDGQDTETTNDWRRNDFDLAGIPGHTGTPVFGEARNTPEAANEAVAEACGDASTHIYAVQGSGATSPLVGGSVAVEGIVVGDFQAGMDGYALQEAPGDGNGATSDGVFISAPGGTAVNPGDLVRVRGTVAESGGRTQINAAQAWVCSSGNALPAPTALTLPMAAADAFEPYEGMRVAFSQTLFISEYYNFDRYGEIVLTTTRQDTPTAVVEPGAAAVALAAANALARLTLDDGRTTENPDPAIHPSGGVFDLTNRFRGGDTVAGVTGVMDYAFDKYRVQPTQGAAYTAANPRPASPPAVGGTLRVASFNVLNYFTTLNSRGANTAEEFTRQRTKIIAALAAINADVVGLIEIENNTAAIADLVTGLNAAMGAGTYAYIDTGVIGGDEIKVALIYKPATVTPYGAHAVLTSAVDARFDSSKNRPALAQSFLNPATHGIFTVVVNHLKSKGSDCGAGDPDLGDGAGNCNLTRRNAALALVDWLADDPTGSGDEDFLIIGDLNSYDKEDPIDALVAGGYTDLIGLYQGEHAYTYVFDGQAGYLDYALAGAALMEEVTGATVWHINADEPDLLDYDMTYKQPPQDALYEPNAYRSSDHDAVIVGLGLESDLPGAFGKLSPADGSTRQGVSVTLTWQAAPLATGYWYCYDTSNDDLCAGWVSAGTATSATISGLSYNTTYYWQVKAGNGVGYSWANGSVGAHWSFSTHTLTTTTLLSVAANDGWILESEESSGKGSTTLDATSETARVGDDAADRQYRSILDFDTAGLPDGAVIVGVTLRVKWQSSTGKNPFNTLSPLRVDVKKGPFQGNVGLEKYDFQAAASRPAAGRIVKAPEAGWYRMVLASARFGLVNLTGHTQFRLRFATDDDDDGVADYMSFFTGNAAQGNQPELIITYYVP